VSFKSKITKTIRWGDLDPLGIVFYPRFYEWMDEASHVLFNRIGLNLVKLLKEKELIFALAETRAIYLKPLMYQDKIFIISYIKKILDKIIIIKHEIIHLKDNAISVEGYEKRICVKQLSDKTLKAITIPKNVRKILEKEK